MEQPTKSRRRRMGVAESVAAELRERILSQDLPDGSDLPAHAQLASDLDVSLPSLREAMRILESEGLVTVRRGNVGGVVVHSPRSRNLAYSLGLVLRSADADLLDVGRALVELEPLCARMCAERDDRAEEVVPRLAAVHEEAQAALDADDFTAKARRFHEELVACCGNRTLIVMVGSIVALWSEHERAWSHADDGPGSAPPRAMRVAGLRTHAKLLDHIAAGRGSQAAALAGAHAREAQAGWGSLERRHIDVLALKGARSGGR